MKQILFSICAAVMLLIPVAASAETQDYSWWYTATDNDTLTTSGSGSLTIDLNLTGTGSGGNTIGFEIISLTGTVNGSAVHLVPTDCSSYPNPSHPCLDDGFTNAALTFDNLFFDPLVGGTHVDFNGIVFATDDGTTYNIYSPYDGQDSQTQILPGDGGSNSQDLETIFNATNTPEPASILLIAGGLAGIGLARRRRLI